jgi:hypothetical protein
MEERLKTLEKHTNNIFLAGAIIGALSCFARADYNLPLYAFLYLLWDKDPVSQSTCSFFLETEIPSHLATRGNLGSRSLMALLLGTPLVLGGNEELATRPAQLCDLRFFRQLGHETGSHRDGLDNSKGIHLIVDIGYTRQRCWGRCPQRVILFFL